MGIRMVRQPSQTPNVTNIDDIIPFRYAYGDQDGYVIGKGNEISHTIDGSTFRVNSGRIVLQGVETDIDANGVSFTIDNASETRYFVVYYEVNLATQTTAIKLSNYDTAGYPTIDLGDDLTVNSSGIARLPLYRFTATSGVISNVERTAKAIKYINSSYIGNTIIQTFSLDTPSTFGNKKIPKLKLLYTNPQGINISGLSTKNIFTNSTSILDKYIVIEHGDGYRKNLSCIKTTSGMASVGHKIYNDVDNHGIDTYELLSYYNVYLWLDGSTYKTLSGQSFCDIVRADNSTSQKVVDYYIYSVYELIL